MKYYDLTPNEYEETVIVYLSEQECQKVKDFLATADISKGVDWAFFGKLVELEENSFPESYLVYIKEELAKLKE